MTKARDACVDRLMDVRDQYDLAFEHHRVARWGRCCEPSSGVAAAGFVRMAG